MERTEPGCILVVDDDALLRDVLADLVAGQGLRVQLEADAAGALRAAAATPFDAIVSDIRLPDRDGVEILPELRRLQPDTPVILMTGFASVDSAVAALRAGAFDYVTKPFVGDQVIASLQRALRVRMLERENARLRRAADAIGSFGGLVGESRAMRDLVALIRKAAVGTHSVLITGESGTGKEVVARTLHLASPRSERAFVPINCTAMPAGLLESELFGHARGAFTGAHARKRGLFEEAHGGTLFLDEIADMPVALQAKLLRVLEEGEIRAVGDTETRRVDVRIIAATNREPIGAIEAGRFREDLYYRLNVVPIHIPPLRERLDDVPALVEAFLLRHADAPVRVSSDALERLRHHSWPGNARELENAIQRALIVMTGSEIRAEDIVLAATAEGESGFDRALLDEAWRRRLTLRELGDLYTARVLDEVGGRKDDAARVLGVSRRTLYRRIGEPADSEQ